MSEYSYVKRRKQPVPISRLSAHLAANDYSVTKSEVQLLFLRLNNISKLQNRNNRMISTPKYLQSLKFVWQAVLLLRRHRRTQRCMSKTFASYTPPPSCTDVVLLSAVSINSTSVPKPDLSAQCLPISSISALLHTQSKQALTKADD